LEYAHNRSYTLKEKASVHYRRDAPLLVVGFSKSGDVCIWHHARPEVDRKSPWSDQTGANDPKEPPITLPQAEGGGYFP
jgi:hypothetical protein